jgi:hypothetical protein
MANKQIHCKTLLGGNTEAGKDFVYPVSNQSTNPGEENEIQRRLRVYF